MVTRKVALVTGASAGVGRAVVRELALNGFDVGLVARGTAGLRAAAQEVEACGAQALVLPADVARFEEVDAAASETETQLGPIDAWVNNAMSTVFTQSWDCEPDDFRRAVEVTFLGQVWGTMATLARMRPRDRGTIVNVGSALCFVGIPLQSAYCASKFACRGFFESTRAELVHEGSKVRLHMVHLPAVNTPQFDWCATSLSRHPQPVPPIYQPEPRGPGHCGRCSRRAAGARPRIMEQAARCPWSPLSQSGQSVRGSGSLADAAHGREDLARSSRQPVLAGRQRR